ncbi:hypothetical protein RclHR1_26730002 [Rhizophagus clarus]|uniref:CCHC-type domain-containing protein n=1 Tax=Rhizophagus clarus TaxID=94130 RepID=A0A2Z6R285_9GLOM|nr:hypothetical protein RclHR1_26730002 [Rhizophagus clarus]GES79554.1 hypothetical protein GLOIN_2v1788342 [Rhizophagus clarus]
MLDINDEFTAYGGQHNYAVFTFLKSFKSYENDLKDVINLIKTCFHANIGVSSCRVVIGQIPLLILRFNNKTYANALHNTFNDALKVTFYKFDEETVNQQIANYLEKIDKKTIKLIDIEANFPTETIINIFKNTYRPIEKIQKIFKRPFIKHQTSSILDNNFNNPRQQKQRNNNNKPTKKQLLITFKNQSSADNIFGNNIWYKTIDHINIRILPANQTSEEYIKRTKYSYKITGIPLNATSQDFKPILTKIGALSCSFTTPSRRQSFKTAYAYMPKSKFINNYTKFNVFNTTIYVFPSTHNKSCTICGNPSHEYQTCDRKSNNNSSQSRPFKKFFINRNSNNKISLNSDITKKFKHLLTGNFTTLNNEKLLIQKLQLILKPQIQPYTPGPIQRPSNTNNWDTPMMELQSEINTLKASLKDDHAKISTLAQENKDLKNQITKLQTDILNNYKVIILIKEQNSRVEIKQDHILEQLNNLFIQLEATEEDNQSDVNNISDNTSQSIYEYSDDTHITRTVYNDREIVFNKENLDLPLLPLSTPNNQTSSINISLLQCTVQSFSFGNL